MRGQRFDPVAAGVEIGPYPLLPGWRVCNLCPPRDNVWPADGPESAFYPTVRNQCIDCYLRGRRERGTRGPAIKPMHSARRPHILAGART